VRVTVYGADGNSDTYITNKISLNPVKAFEPVSSKFIDLSDITEVRTEVRGKGNYRINQDSNPNPTLTLMEGETYTFNINALGHPFWIKTVRSTGTENAYSSGVTNNGIANGTITFTVPYDAPSTLYYNCEIHSSMGGIINIIDVPAPVYTPTEPTSPEPIYTPPEPTPTSPEPIYTPPEPTPTPPEPIYTPPEPTPTPPAPIYTPPEPTPTPPAPIYTPPSYGGYGY
jgi:hypothetical protein